MDIQDRINLVSRYTEEIVTYEELKNLFETKSSPEAYWGFECSGFMHLGLGLVCGLKIRDIVDAGFNFTIFLADWHSWINNKLGGSMENIHACGEYFKDCFKALGVVSNKTRFLWSSELTGDIRYWEKVIHIAKVSSLLRIRRALTIMGREMDLKDIETAWIFYPCMQAADIFQMNLDLVGGGLDQRKAHMLARDVADKLRKKKPISIHTSLLTGLLRPSLRRSNGSFDKDSKIDNQIALKMSKSRPESCIFIHDSPKKIKYKIQGAYCPQRKEENNPILEHARHIIFPWLGNLEIPRSSKFGGLLEIDSYESLRESYLKGKIHPLDLKNGVAKSLIKILKPVREYFKDHPDNLEKMKMIETTR